MTLAIGTLAKLGMGAAGTAIGSVTEAYEFMSESLKANKTFLDLSGIRGTRSHPKERCRVGTYSVTGPISFQPTPEEMANLLPRILGAAPSGTTFAVAEDLPEFDVFIDRITKVFTYAGCKCISANFKGSSGSPLTLDMNIVGKTETISNAGTAIGSSLVPGLTAPYVFMDGVLTLSGDTREFKDFDLMIDNVADTSRFMNSLTLTDIPILDRKVTLTVTVPYTTDNADLYDQALAGAAGTLVFTNGNYSTTFTFANLKATSQATPTVNAKQELMLGLNLTAYMSSTTKEIVVTHDSTP